MGTSPKIVDFFTKSGNRYIYDFSTNLVFPYSVSFSVIKAVSKFQKKSLSFNKIKGLDDAGIERLLESMRKYELFFSLPSINYSYPKDVDLKGYKVQIANASHLLLNLTEDCNLRCRYCIYSGNYPFFRPHRKRRMSWEVAKKSIDFFLSLLKSPYRTVKFNKNVFFTFYGGEPLLAWKMLKRCVEYALERRKKLKIKENFAFSISTNGTLLTENKLKFLTEIPISLNISIDGDKVIHDKNRIYPSGKGSFKVVLKNLLYVHEKFPKYYKRYVNFLVTVDPETDITRINNFFRSYPQLFEGHLFLISDVAPGNETFDKMRINKRARKKFFEKFFTLITTKQYDRISSFMRSYFRKEFGQIYRKSYLPLSKKRNFTGACFPGNRRLFVSTEGNFHICERINQNFPIGNYKEGIIFERIEKIVEKYREQIWKNCGSCPAVHFCSLCYASTANKNSFSTKDMCNEEKKKIVFLLTQYYSILEINPDAFDYLFNNDEAGNK